MITKLFLLQLLMTFFAGSTWIYLTVLSGMRFGSKISGFIAGLPSTALLSFFFIGYTQSPETASGATVVFPLSMGISGIFLIVYAWMAKRSFLPAMVTGIMVWFVLSFFVVWLRPINFVFNLVVYAVSMLMAYFFLEKYLRIRSVSDNKSGFTGKHTIVRSLFGGFIIMLTVLIAKAGGPVLGGVFAGFPAMFISTLVISYKIHGKDFARAMAKPLLVTGMITIAVYAVAIKYLYLSTGIYWGTLIAICISAVSAYLTFRFILPKLS
jgi:hypothetical protein